MQEFDVTKHYTCNDFKDLHKTDHFELFEGKFIEKPNYPQDIKREIMLKLITRLSSALEGKGFQLLLPPINLVLGDDIVVQPDLVIAKDLSKLNGNYYHGIPEVIVDIYFPEDDEKPYRFYRRDKRIIYRTLKAPEIWVVDPLYRNLQMGEYDEELGRHRFGDYYGGIGEDTVTLKFIPDISIKLLDILINYREHEFFKPFIDKSSLPLLPKSNNTGSK